MAKHSASHLAYFARDLNANLAQAFGLYEPDTYVGRHRAELPPYMRVRIRKDGRRMHPWMTYVPGEPTYALGSASIAFSTAQTVVNNWCKFAWIYARERGASVELQNLIKHRKVGFLYGRAKASDPLHEAELRAMRVDKEDLGRTRNFRALYGGQCDRGQGGGPEAPQSWREVIAVYRDAYRR